MRALVLKRLRAFYRRIRQVGLKIKRRDTDVLIMDRQTSIAVDIAEQTASKTALQNAATELAERIIPKLAK